LVLERRDRLDCWRRSRRISLGWTLMILFVAGTDTAVGKTLVSGLLARHWAGQGMRTLVQKWVTTGCTGFSDDVRHANSFTSEEEIGRDGTDLSPYCFSLAASPHLASEQEGRTVSATLLAAATQRLEQRCDLLVLEGVGGVLVPLRRDLLLADLVARFGLPTMVVARSGLGTLNHTLLTLEALRSRGIPVLAVLLNTVGEEDRTIVDDNRQTIKDMGKVDVFGPLPRIGTPDEAGSVLAPLAARLRRLLKERPWS